MGIECHVPNVADCHQYSRQENNVMKYSGEHCWIFMFVLYYVFHVYSSTKIFILTVTPSFVISVHCTLHLCDVIGEATHRGGWKQPEHQTLLP